MELTAIILLSLVAGWAVNLAADLLPQGVPSMATLQRSWRRPVAQFLGPRAIHGESPMPVSRMRAAGVWIAALVLGYLALGRTGFSPLNLLVALYGWFFLAVAVIDLEHRRVLNIMLLAFVPVALVASLWLQTPAWHSALAGGLLGFVFFLAIALIRPGGMGMGDVKLAGAIGLVTGWSGVLTALTIGIFAGGIAAAVILVRSRWAVTKEREKDSRKNGQLDRKLTMAYAPYLVLGAWIALYI